jgi:hypothetical protein
MIWEEGLRPLLDFPSQMGLCFKPFQNIPGDDTSLKLQG